MVYFGLIALGVLGYLIHLAVSYRYNRNGWYPLSRGEALREALLSTWGWWLGTFIVSSLFYLFATNSLPGANPERSGFTYELIERSPHELRALNVGDPQLSGSFFLGSGSLDSERYLTYVEAGQGGELRIQQIAAQKARIFESDTVTPTVEYSTFRVSAPWLVPGSATIPGTTSFTIPSGSIIENYQIQP